MAKSAWKGKVIFESERGCYHAEEEIKSNNSKQGLISDHSSLNSPSRKFISKPTASSLIPSPAFFVWFSDAEASAMIPTSIFEAKSFSATGRHFISDKKLRACETKHHPWDVTDSNTVILRILDALSHEKTDKKSPNLGSRLLLCGSQLKFHSPSTSHNGSVIEFGVRNKNSQLAMAPILLSPTRSSVAAGAPMPELPLPILCLSAIEMEKSEDYTRVVSHGPNPRTTHIFDACILESCGNGINSMRKEIRFSIDGASGHQSDDFMAFCNSYNNKLGQENDIFMYRGEAAFCSHECRNKTSRCFLVEWRIQHNVDHCLFPSLKKPPPFDFCWVA